MCIRDRSTWGQRLGRTVSQTGVNTYAKATEQKPGNFYGNSFNVTNENKNSLNERGKSASGGKYFNNEPKDYTPSKPTFGELGVERQSATPTNFSRTPAYTQNYAVNTSSFDNKPPRPVTQGSSGLKMTRDELRMLDLENKIKLTQDNISKVKETIDSLQKDKEELMKDRPNSGITIQHRTPWAVQTLNSFSNQTSASAYGSHIRKHNPYKQMRKLKIYLEYNKFLYSSSQFSFHVHRYITWLTSMLLISFKQRVSVTS
eukprot:TRINITY_DN2879_c0_g1_i3.p1 TRINITY_DN2879_c0_g1~~TRINITY_DN2879_c0_g1_i3.p1  ORF type:complete len:259 (+),score=27.15 TRINITY_DN2879_c0_g1_i3:67-843(+)